MRRHVGARITWLARRTERDETVLRIVRVAFDGPLTHGNDRPPQEARTVPMHCRVLLDSAIRLVRPRVIFVNALGTATLIVFNSREGIAISIGARDAAVGQSQRHTLAPAAVTHSPAGAAVKSSVERG